MQSIKCSVLKQTLGSYQWAHFDLNSRSSGHDLTKSAPAAVPRSPRYRTEGTEKLAVAAEDRKAFGVAPAAPKGSSSPTEADAGSRVEVDDLHNCTGPAENCVRASCHCLLA